MSNHVHNKNYKNARRYFGIENNPEMVLHHKDPALKTRDVKRYLEWRVEDLEVMTKSEHSHFHRGRHNSNSKPVICVELSKWFGSAGEASDALGISRTGISRCCTGQNYYNTAGGYHWRWADA